MGASHRSKGAAFGCRSKGADKLRVRSPGKGRGFYSLLLLLRRGVGTRRGALIGGSAFGQPPRSSGLACRLRGLSGRGSSGGASACCSSSTDLNSALLSDPLLQSAELMLARRSKVDVSRPSEALAAPWETAERLPPCGMRLTPAALPDGACVKAVWCLLMGACACCSVGIGWQALARALTSGSMPPPPPLFRLPST